MLFIDSLYECARSLKTQFSETPKDGDSQEKKIHAIILRRRHSSGNLVKHKKNEIFEIFEIFENFDQNCRNSRNSRKFQKFRFFCASLNCH